MTGRNGLADVLIVGAGAAGGVAAKDLAEAGFGVVVLEQGDWVKQSEIPTDKPEFELWGAKQWAPNPNDRGKREDYPLDNSESDVHPWMFSAVGGGTHLYAGCWSRMLPSDFRVKTLDGVADDWPISYEELRPYYELIDLEWGVSALSGNPAYPPGSFGPLPVLPIHKTGRQIAIAFNKLGWHWWPGCNSIASEDYGTQVQCERYGNCRMGCPSGAKASTDVVQLPIAQKHGAKIVANARVSQITLDEKGCANGAVYIKDGKEQFQPASLVVVTANGIGTPRLLLMSAQGRFPNGLANSSGLVGRNLMLHPYSTSCGIYEEELEDWIGPSQLWESMQFYETDKSRGFVRGTKWQVMPTGGPLTTIFGRWLAPELANEPFWGESFAAKMKASIGHMIELAVVPEDLPEETNYVSLSPTLEDSDGLPAPRIHYRTSENTKKMVEWNLQRSLEVHKAAGATKTWVTERDRTSGHIMGTCRMGNDPATSVTNKWGQFHDVPNLFTSDGSVFVTSAGVNATATIAALTKRMSTYIIEHARDLEVAK